MELHLLARAAAALLVLVCGPAPAAAPPQMQPINYLPAIAGDYFPIESKALGTTYHVYVRYPLGYGDKPAERYPVVYLLDGDSAFRYWARSICS